MNPAISTNFYPNVDSLALSGRKNGTKGEGENDIGQDLEWLPFNHLSSKYLSLAFILIKFILMLTGIRRPLKF